MSRRRVVARRPELPADHCCALIDEPTDYPVGIGDRYYCGAHAPGSRVELTATREGTSFAELRRGPVVAGPYCAAHGGRVEAEANARRAWDYLAPDSVGHRGRVLTAGCTGLASPDAYLVVRQVPAEQRPPLWRVHLPAAQRLRTWGRPWPEDQRTRGVLRVLGLATGCLTTPDEARAHRVVELARRYWGVELTVESIGPSLHHHAHPWHAQLGVGGMLIDLGAFRFRDDALIVGGLRWRDRVWANVEEIRAARGGTLDWGLPVEPLLEPIVLEPREGESAWEAVARAPRHAPVGLGALTGKRSSGEVL